ncbi:MAG: glycerol dehydratase reactivase beta/small subunit family protein [Desulfobacterales bacterium]|nr:glycerol dehydratase reactivase beta/small subunit family protein [Desulfobacterales bacterium]
MGDGKALTDESAPSVQIWVRRPVSEHVIASICWGLEEEGIPAEIQYVEQGAARSLGKEAAKNSRLNVGIGIDGRAKEAVLHHRDLPEDKPLFLYEESAFEAVSLRRLGANSARVVKGDPLIFENTLQDWTTDGPSAQVEKDCLQDAVVRIVAEFLNQTT